MSLQKETNKQTEIFFKKNIYTVFKDIVKLRVIGPWLCLKKISLNSAVMSLLSRNTE